MTPLRVLFAIGSMEIGGAERQVVRYLQRLDRSRFTPGLCLVAKRGPLLADVPADVPIFSFEDRVRPSRIYLPGRIHRQQVRDLAAVLDAYGADVLVTRTFHQTLIAGPAVRLRPTPLVAIEASDPRRDFPRQVSRFRRLKRRLIARAYREATAIVALSEGSRESLCSFYELPHERVTVLPNFVDIESIDRLAAEPGPSLDPSRFHVVAVGRLSPEKGHDVLIAAANRLVQSGRLSNLHVHFLGDGPSRQELGRLAVDLSLTDHVTFVGALQNPFAWLARCDLFCLPSRYEGMPLALLEAMACGVPVVASDCVSGPREVLAGGEFGTLVPPDNPEALAEAIAGAAQNTEAMKSRTDAARKQIETSYSAPAVIARLEQLLEHAAKRPERPVTDP